MNVLAHRELEEFIRAGTYKSYWNNIFNSWSLYDYKSLSFIKMTN